MDELVKNIVDPIVKNIRPARVMLFGSRARGNASPESDVDLLVLYDGPHPKRQVQIDIRHLFAHPDFSLDLFIMTTSEYEASRTLPNSLAREVSEHGVVCHG